MNLNFPMRAQDSLIDVYLRYVLREATKPFNLGKVNLFSDYNIDHMTYTIVVEFEKLPDYPFIWDVPRDAILDHPTKGDMSALYDAALSHFRNRPALPVDDHIILGED